MSKKGEITREGAALYILVATLIRFTFTLDMDIAFSYLCGFVWSEFVISLV